MGLGFSESLLDTHSYTPYNYYHLQYHLTSGPVHQCDVSTILGRDWIPTVCSGGYLKTVSSSVCDTIPPTDASLVPGDSWMTGHLSAGFLCLLC
jgi:hypothetical protein